MTYTFKPKRVCSIAIKFDLEDGIISNVSFTGGCDGNLKAISKLVEGQKAEKDRRYCDACFLCNIFCISVGIVLLKEQFKHGLLFS